MNELNDFQPSPLDRPTVEQLQEYRNLLVDVLHRQGRDIKYSAHYSKDAHVRANTEYLTPRTLTEWTEATDDIPSQIERDRAYCASVRRMGEGALRMIVVEHENQLTAVPEEGSESGELQMTEVYVTERRQYLVAYNPLVGTYEAQVGQLHKVTNAKSESELVFMDELTETNDEERREEVDEVVWRDATAADFDELIERTRQYADDYDAAHPVVKPTE